MAARLESQEEALDGARSRVGSWKGIPAKGRLCTGGCWLLYTTSRTAGSIFVLAAISLGTYLAAWLLASRPVTAVHKVCGRIAVPIGLASVVLLNMFGV